MMQHLKENKKNICFYYN